MLLIQYIANGLRRVGVVDGDTVTPLVSYRTMLELAQAAITCSTSLAMLASSVRDEQLSESFEAVAREGRLLVPLDHPDVAHCAVTGTTLTRSISACACDATPCGIETGTRTLSDGKTALRADVVGGKPTADDRHGRSEWYYKGNGTTLHAGGKPLEMPDLALDGSGQPEIAGLYVVALNGRPYRIGFALGNSFSDHLAQRYNYRCRARSTVRNCGVGPALLVGTLPNRLEGFMRVFEADGKVRLEKAFDAQARDLSDVTAAFEHHYFACGLSGWPGDVHIHFFGAAALSFSGNVLVHAGEMVEISSPQFELPLRNRLVGKRYPNASVAVL